MIMNGLAVKDVQFNGATLRAAQDAENIIWVGVAWVCNGLGLNKNQKDRQVKNIQNDELLVEGCVKFDAGVFDDNNETLALQLDYIPAWLFKIKITPKMKRDTPELAERLLTYQLKAKDVLAAAFLKNAPGIVPVTHHEYEQKIDRLESKIDKMYKDMSSLANIILDWKESSKNNIPVMPESRNTNTYSSWKETMYQKMDRICANTMKFDKRSDVMRWIYKYMTKNYGVVWEQEEREYKERNHTCITPSTIDIVMDKVMIKSIFESVLADLEYEYCHKTVEKSDKEIGGWSDRIIAPLVKKYNDHSNAGMVTYRRVYKKMDEDNKIAWNNLTTRYINEHGRKPSRKDLIETRPSLRKKFKTAVKELMEE